MINVLDKQTRELIAAGEVVERPASAVKELLENAVDAGAARVRVELVSNGLKSITVTDDGCGIPYGEIETAFLRHATSKISSPLDLESIGTLGFRGEALPSIASVSRVTLRSKTRDEDDGGEYRCEGGENAALCVCGCPDGTSISVEDIFFNTPARMKWKNGATLKA